MTRPGLISLRSPYPSPQRSIVPGRKFSTSTSAVSMSLLARSCPSPSRRFSVTDFLLRAIMGHQRVCPALLWRPHSRIGSPLPGGSTFMTSAPKSPRSWPQKGPARRLPISTTRTPSRGGCVPFPTSLIASPPRGPDTANAPRPGAVRPAISHVPEAALARAPFSTHFNPSTPIVYSFARSPFRGEPRGCRAGSQGSSISASTAPPGTRVPSP